MCVFCPCVHDEFQLTIYSTPIEPSLYLKSFGKDSINIVGNLTGDRYKSRWESTCKFCAEYENLQTISNDARRFILA